jgi:competence protein ComEA
MLMADVVNINHANAKTLAENLKGIGKTKARAIVAYRKKHGLFKDLNELLNVKGIGEKTLAANRKNIILRPKKK